MSTVKKVLEKVALPNVGYCFDEVNHIHYLDGKRLIGTTTVLGVVAKPQLIPWAVGMAIEHIKLHGIRGEKYYTVSDKVLDEAKVAHTKNKERAAEAGTDVHAQIEALVKNAIANGGYLNHITVSGNKQVNNFVDWAKSKNVKFLESEKNIYSRKMWIGGICDLVGEIQGKVYVMDIKTSKFIYDTYWWQLAAYQLCLQEMGYYPEIEGHIIIKTSDRTGFEVAENKDFKGNSTAFKACLFIHKQLESLKKK